MIEPNIAPKAEYVNSCTLKLSGPENPSEVLLRPINIAEKPMIPKAICPIS
jgi:hypothetical protein